MMTAKVAEAVRALAGTTHKYNTFRKTCRQVGLNGEYISNSELRETFEMCKRKQPRKRIANVNRYDINNYGSRGMIKC